MRQPGSERRRAPGPGGEYTARSFIGRNVNHGACPHDPALLLAQVDHLDAFAFDHVENLFDAGWLCGWCPLPGSSVTTPAVMRSAPVTRGSLDENLYIRYEDTVVVSGSGYENFTDFLPAELDDLEKLVREGGGRCNRLHVSGH